MGSAKISDDDLRALVAEGEYGNVIARAGLCIPLASEVLRLREQLSLLGAGDRSGDDVAERTLYHLSQCRQADRDLSHQEHITGETGSLEKVGPKDSSWPDLLAAIMEGIERGWVEEAHLTRKEGLTHMHWRGTERGDRAMDAHMRRIQGAKIVDNTGEEAS